MSGARYSGSAVVVQSVAHLPFLAGDGGSTPTPRLHRNDWRVHPVGRHSDAARLVRLWHYSKSAPNTSTYRFGLWPTDGWWGDPFGVSLWIPPTRTAAAAIAGDDRAQSVLACSRLAVAPEMPTNAASFLLAWSRRQIDRERWPVLVSYADTALGHTGAIYLADGWTCDGPTKAGDVWLTKFGERVGRKRGRFTYTRDEMIAMGCTRAPDAPKIRFRHEVER